MRKVALRGLLAHKLRLAMTVSAVALGVAFIAGVLVFTDTLERSFDDVLEVAFEDTDAVVRSADTIGGGFGEFEQRGTVDEALVDRIAELPSVDVAAGEVEGFAQIIDPDGEAVSGGTFGGPTFVAGIDAAAFEEGDTEAVSEFGLRQGDWPRSDDELVLDAATERRVDYALGDQVPLQTEAGLREYTLVGTLGFGDADDAAGQGVVVLTTAEAQRAVGQPGRLDTITIVAAEGVSQAEVVEDVQAVVGPGVEVLSGEGVLEDAQSELREALSFVTIFFGVFAGVAVVVGGFVIYNSFSIIVAQRTREMALLRAIGASRRQVRRAVVLEAVATGAAGSAIGFGLGVGLAAAFSGLFGFETSLAILPTSVAIAVVVGLVVTVASALLPAWRASRVPPVAALRDVAIDTAGRSRLRLVAGWLLSGLGVALAAAGAGSGEVDTVGIGVALTFVGVIVLAAGLARPVGAALGWPVARLRGVTGRLAQQNAVRNPRRTASTALALTIGVGIVAFFLILNTSVRSSFDKIVDDTFAGDFLVQAGGSEGLLSVPEEVVPAVDELPEVDRVTPLRFVDARLDGGREAVVGTAPTVFEAFGFPTEGTTDLAAGEVVVRDSTAEQAGLRPGDPVTLVFLDDVSATLEVSGLYEDKPGIDVGDFVVGSDELARHVAGGAADLVVIDLADGVAPEAARGPLDATVAAIAPTAEVQDSEDLKDSVAGELDDLLQLVLALLLFAIVIAVFGIANTIALSVLERTRELGLLRAVGMSRAQLRSAVRWESVIIALFGTTLGLAVGALGSWGIITALRDEGFEVFSVPVGVLALLAVLAGVAGMVAALSPAWRASRKPILEAIQHE